MLCMGGQYVVECPKSYELKGTGSMIGMEF